MKSKDKKEKKKDPNRIKLKPLDIEDKREILDELMIDENDEEILEGENNDEFMNYFKYNRKPKILLTTSETPSSKMFGFLKEIKSSFPHCYYYPRQKYKIKEIAEYAYNRDYTTLMIFRESRKQIN